MNVLVDTSVWVSHFKKANSHLVQLAASDRLITHSMVIGEIACGTPPNRSTILSDFAMLRVVSSVSIEELMLFIDENRLFGRGCGFVDLSLLAASLITSNTLLWTYDKRLSSLALEFGLGYSDSHMHG